MLDFLFRRLTAEQKRGARLFDAVTRIARHPHWYVEGKIADTIDGRFAVLATVAALVVVRLEQEGARGDAASVALTERFVEVMEAEHRELGLGDPTLGKTVRRLVGSLARRTERWRSAICDLSGWIAATRDSLYRDGVAAEALKHSSDALMRLWLNLQANDVHSLEEGKLE
ncbi:MAG TPA: ubiquinol-cytochrome C chaperone family protein [Sphingomicrobium sp.]|nr:ubiquinol-cytochrome C chaperone family protein [Sphingomicrobium sp.]